MTASATRSWPSGRRAAQRITTALLTAPLALAAASPARAAGAPTPNSQQPPGVEGLTTLLGWGSWLVSFVCVAGLLIVAGMMALQHNRGQGGQAMGSLGWVLGACVIGAAAGPIANALI